ncbi:DUF1329 domain-containing protein [Wenzhouxiangella sp. XN79A]|uniref:DUF1329 domain-containing protein n=1 Tax=Wenzhouxiangella sp. XN79A TaxID=2724193 RepID=UPI00197E2283|nr:DUF1329 domain-containing protein [Wenzhouxiangella sp. XN79A]
MTKNLIALLAAAGLAITLTACGTTPDDGMNTEQAAAEQADAEQAARAEAERRAAAEAEAEARAAAEAERRAAAEAEARAAAEAEAERRAAEEAARAEAERRAAEAAAAAEAERAAAEQAAAEAAAAAEEQAAAGRMAAEQAAAEEAERVAAEAAAAEEAERVAAEAAAAEDAARAEAERLAAEQAAAAEAAAARASATTQATGTAADSAAAEGVIPRTPENIARLGNDLTPMGSVRAGNAEGTIPAWTGGITRDDWPAGFEPGDRHPNPFPNDRPEFVITGENYMDYADQLSAGQIATFQRYPDTYYMRIYPTRRSASFPERTYEMSIRNASTAQLVSDGEGITNAAEGFPFPIPQNAYELMWNHKLKYKGTGGTRYNNQVAPTAGGNFQLVKLREEILGLYYKEGVTIADTNNILLYFFQEVESPARLAGNILLVHETLDQIQQPRQAWIYNPGQRRVRRAPNVAYDNPGTASDGLRTNDMTDMFNGAMDRFDWRIVGKKEMYVPYNSYDAHGSDVTPEDLVMAGHLNPEYMRYELHRVWIVDATLKEGTRHINSRRTFYMDEDSYQILLIDHYDQNNELWRASEAHSINYYEVPTFWSTIETHMDLLSGRYVAVGIDNQDPVNTFNVELAPSNYTPQALRTRGRR